MASVSSLDKSDELSDLYTQGSSAPSPMTKSDTALAADTAMATGNEDEPEMTIADKHAGDLSLDPYGDGTLTMDEAAEILGAKTKATQKNDTNKGIIE